MPIGNVSNNTPPRRESFRPPWVKEKDTESPPAWMQKKLKPVNSISKTMPVENDAEPSIKPLKPVLKKQTSIRDNPENGVSETVEEKLIKPSAAKQADRLSSAKPIEEKPKFIKPAIKPALKSEEKIANDKVLERPVLRSVRTIDDKAKEKSVTIIDKKIDKNGINQGDNVPNKKNDKTPSFINDSKPAAKTNIVEKPLVKLNTVEKPFTKNNTIEKPQTKLVPNEKPGPKVTTIDKPVTKVVPVEKPVPKISHVEKPETKIAPVEKLVTKISSIEKLKPKVAENDTETKKINDKTATKTVKSEKTVNKAVEPEKPSQKTTPEKTSNKVAVNDKPVTKVSSKETPKAGPEKTASFDKVEDKSKMATKPPTPIEKTPSKVLRKPPLQKQPSKDEIGLKKWRDPLLERVKENIDKTLANEIPKGHTLTKNESLRSLLKPTPPPMPPPLPPKLPPPPEFKKDPLDPVKLKRIEQLRSRPRKRPDWSDMMKEVEQGKKLKHVVCNDRSSPIITKSTVVKNKDQFIFESEKPNSHNELLKEISKGVRLKKVKTNDRSKPNLEGLRKFRRQMTIEEQVQKSMSQANLAASPSGVLVAEGPVAVPDEEEIDEMDDIDKVRDDLQSTKQLLAIELRNKEAQEREIKRLQTRIQNLEAEVARERAIIKQEQHKTVISVTDAYDERLVTNLKMEVEKAKETADNLEKQYLEAAEERDTAITELEEVKRRNAELEKKLEQAMSGVMPTNMGSRRSSHAIKQLSVTKDDSFEEESESEEEEEESEEKKQRRMEKEVRNMRNKIRHLKEKQDHMKKERMGFKMALKNQQAALKEEKRKYKELKREVDKMAAMMKEVGSDEEDEEEEEEESEEEKKTESEEETETETEQDTESETESESEPEEAPLPNKKENLTKRVKRHETRVHALKKGNALLMANVDRLKDDVLKQREESVTLQKELDSLIDDLE